MMIETVTTLVLPGLALPRDRAQAFADVRQRFVYIGAGSRMKALGQLLGHGTL
jgi:hypothetical protein